MTSACAQMSLYVSTGQTALEGIQCEDDKSERQGSQESSYRPGRSAPTQTVCPAFLLHQFHHA